MFSIMFLVIVTALASTTHGKEEQRPVANGVQKNVVRKDVDLRQHPVAKKIREKLLKPLAQGNQGDAGFDEFTLNTATGEVYGRIWVRSKHNTGHPFHVTTFDWTVRGDFRFNPSGKVEGNLDLGGGIKVSLKDIAILIVLANL